MGSSLKSVVWLPLPWIRKRPLATHGITHSTRTEFSLIPLGRNSRSFHPDRNSVWPMFHFLRISHSRNFVRPTFHLLRISHIRTRPTFHLFRIFHSRRLPLDGRGGRFNFPGQTCPDPLVVLIRRTSVTNDSNSPDSLACQILAIRRIHFRPQSKNKLRQY